MLTIISEIMKTEAENFLVISGSYSSVGLKIVSLIGVFITYYLFIQAAMAAYLLLKLALSYIIFTTKERKRIEQMKIRRNERKKIEERVAYDKQFEELYNTYVS